MGTEHSTNARITECFRKYCDFNFQYMHDGEPGGQGAFGGTIFLKYKYKEMKNRKVKIYGLSGKYINSKTGKNFEGVVGRIAFRRVSLEILELEDALEKGKDYLNALKKVISSQISDDPDIQFSQELARSRTTLLELIGRYLGVEPEITCNRSTDPFEGSEARARMLIVGLVVSNIFLLAVYSAQLVSLLS